LNPQRNLKGLKAGKKAVPVGTMAGAAAIHIIRRAVHRAVAPPNANAAA